MAISRILVDHCISLSNPCGLGFAVGLVKASVLSSLLFGCKNTLIINKTLSIIRTTPCVRVKLIFFPLPEDAILSIDLVVLFFPPALLWLYCSENFLANYHNVQLL